MNIKRLADGSLLVPCRVEYESGIIGDGEKKLNPGTDEFIKWMDYLNATGMKPIEVNE